MATDLRVYDNQHGDPVVVMVTTGTHDVSRLVSLMEKGRCEDHASAGAILAGVRRHSGGRAALKVLADHGGPDLLTPAKAGPEISETERWQVEEAREALARWDRSNSGREISISRALADHLRAVLAIADQLAPQGGPRG